MTASPERRCPVCNTPLAADSRTCSHCGRTTPSNTQHTSQHNPIDEQFRRIGRALAGRYNIERSIGEGGIFGLSNLVRGGGGDATGTNAPRIAVLPFTAQGSAEDSLFTDGIMDEVRGKLSHVAGLTVLASTSTNPYRGSTKSPQEIARELRAEYLLMGRVRWTGSGANRRVQVVSEVITGATGVTKWQDAFDAAMTDVFTVQSQLASRVATALGAALGAAETAELAHRPTDNLQAWNLYLQAKKPGPYRNKITLLEAAVALDSTFAEAWGLLAETAGAAYFEFGQDPAHGKRSREALERVQRLAPKSLAAYLAQARYFDTMEPDLPRALAAADSALRIAPNDIEALRTAAGMDVAAGRMDSAVARVARARELDPRSP